MTSSRLSPHYFIDFKRKSPTSHSEAAEIIRRAHEAVKYIASLDADKAAINNGFGFSKSDVVRGHNLARWPTEIVCKHPFLAAFSMQLARRYRRQLPPSLLVDPPDQKTLDV